MEHKDRVTDAPFLFFVVRGETQSQRISAQLRKFATKKQH